MEEKIATYTNRTSTEPITLKDLEGAMNDLWKFGIPPIIDKIEVNKKTLKAIKRQTKDVYLAKTFGISSMYGIRVFLKPYIKKVKVYYQK